MSTLHASKIMDEHSAATSECYEKLKEMTIRIRSCCNVLDSIVDTAMDSWAVSTRLAGRVFRRWRTNVLLSAGQRPHLFGTRLKNRLIICSHSRRTDLATFEQLTIR